MEQISSQELDRLIAIRGIKLEITGGVPTWRIHPIPRHQMIIDRIRATIMPIALGSNACGCYHRSDVYVRFPDKSLKRPDIAIFCTRPPEQDEALDILPVAVIEIISPGYEEKDLSINPSWYLSQEVGDVVTLDPGSGVVTHFRASKQQTLHSPIVIDLVAGCRCTV